MTENETKTLLATREAREVVARQMAYQHITDHPDAWVDMSEQRRDGWRARAQSVIDALLASGVVQEPAEFVAGLAEDEAAVGYVENFVPLGFDPARDPYRSVTEAAREILKATAAFIAGDR